jgi:uncharacterized protein
MLIEFRVANHRSIRDEQVLSMEAGRVGDETDARPRKIPGHSESLLTVAGLYGANASGKSNVLAALAFMCESVAMSHRFWAPNRSERRSDEPLVPRDPFAWGDKKKEPSLFEVVFLLDEVKYQYGFQVNDDCFLEEWLYAWPNGKKQKWYVRDRQSFDFGENLKGENKIIESITRTNSLFLSAGAQLHHAQLEPIYSWFQSSEIVNLPHGKFRFGYLFGSHWLSTYDAISQLLGDNFTGTSGSNVTLRSAAKFDNFRDLLKKADDTIVDVRETEETIGGKTPSYRRFYFKHKNDSADEWLPLEEESQGTQTMFNMALPVINVLENGGIVVVDELERSLHPSLARLIVLQFNDRTANPKNAQMFFTTHDTNLLGTTVGEPALRRDQVWLTEKDADGATALYPLTDYNPRKAENLERGYLQGRYGAIPFLGDHLVGEK